MSRSRRSFAAVASTVVAALSAAAVAAADEPAPLRPPTEQVLLAAPDPAGPTTRGVFLADPAGQVEHLVAVAHLVAWTVRTPADQLAPASKPHPVTLPTSTRLVVVDERGGAPLTVDFPGRRIEGLRAFRGGGGPADPRIAVRSCTARKASTCADEVLALTPDVPLALRSQQREATASAAYLGRIDSGHRLVLGKRAGHGKRKACLPPLSVRTLAGGAPRKLPAIPGKADFDWCGGLTSSFIFGRYVFASVSRYASDYGYSAGFLYGFDLQGGTRARWREIAQPSGSSEYADHISLGPAVTDQALYLQEVATDETVTVTLERVLLPDGVTRAPRKTDLVRSEPIGPPGQRGCTIAATDSALYELSNARCGALDGAPSEIRRVTNPAFAAVPN